MEYRTLTYERDGHVTVLTYNRPEQRNAVNREMNSELHHAWRRFRDDEDAFVLVITGAGEAFCAGWDLADAAETRMDDWDEFRTHVYNGTPSSALSRDAGTSSPVTG
jgi:enoyl-CoA hydratase/carnithine racemase